MEIIILLLPTISVLVGIIPLFFVKRKLGLLGLAIVAYFIAILAKEAIQLPFLKFFETPSTPTYIAYGLQTTFLEPGFAYLILYLVRKTYISIKDISYGFSYGVYLAFSENALLVGLLSLPSYILILLGLAPTPINLTTTSTILSSLIPYTLDRISSLVLHTFWGFSAYLSILKNNKLYLVISMPFGMLDSLTAWWDFTRPFSYLEFSIIVFLISIISVLVMIYESNIQNKL